MSEKEKMLHGDFYDSRDPELLCMYHNARNLLKKYNHLNSELTQERENVLNELFDFKGTGVWIETPFFCDYGKIFPSAKIHLSTRTVCFWTTTK